MIQSHILPTYLGELLDFSVLVGFPSFLLGNSGFLHEFITKAYIAGKAINFHMSSLEELMTKAKDLHTEGHSSGQIADELSLSVDTVTWLLTQGKAGIATPKDVHIDWTNVSSNTTLLDGISSMMLAHFEAANEEEEGIDTVIGISVSGVPIATMIAAEDGLNLAIYHPSKHNPEGKIGSISGNFSKVSQKRCIIVDDCITTGNTLTEIVNYPSKTIDWKDIIFI